MNRTVGLAVGLVLVFVVTVVVEVMLVPGPHKPTDYLVFGAVATLVCLLLLFLILTNTMKKPDAGKPRKPSG